MKMMDRPCCRKLSTIPCNRSRSDAPSDVAGSAAHHALTLARWTKQPLWADYVVELHLSARLVMSGPTLAAFEDVISKLDFDRMLLGYYVEGLQNRIAKLDIDERRRVERLKFLVSEER